MTGRNTTPDASLEVGSSDTVFQGRFAAWTGFFVAGTGSPVAGLTATPPVVLAGTYLAVLTSATAVGVVLARRLHGPSARLGRPWPRRLITTVSMALLVVAVLVSLFGSVESVFELVALGSTFGVAIAGLAVARIAENRYVDAVTRDEPLAAWQWEPSRSVRHDRFLILAWVILAIVNTISGELVVALILVGFAASIAAFGPARGRVEQWLPGEFDTPPEVRVYEAGIVTTRPYVRRFVPWKSISHVRLRDDELVVDRGLFDLRFDRDELEDPEAVRAAIERGLENADSRAGTDSPP